MLLLAEFVPPKDGEPEKRHIVSAFKLVQDLLAMPSSRGRNGFQLLVDILPPEHKARWLAQRLHPRSRERFGQQQPAELHDQRLHHVQLL